VLRGWFYRVLARTPTSGAERLVTLLDGDLPGDEQNHWSHLAGLGAGPSCPNGEKLR